MWGQKQDGLLWQQQGVRQTQYWFKLNLIDLFLICIDQRMYTQIKWLDDKRWRQPRNEDRYPQRKYQTLYLWFVASGMLRWPQRSTGPRHVAVTISVYDVCGYYSSSDFKNDLRVPQLTRGNVFVCLFLCQSQAQSGPKVGVVRVKHWDNLKVWEKQAYRTRMEAMREILRLKSWASQRWETTQWWQDGGLWETQVCLKTDYTLPPQHKNVFILTSRPFHSELLLS